MGADNTKQRNRMQGLRAFAPAAWLALLLCAAGLARAESEKKSAAPNLLLISIDTLRADHTSAYGYGRKTTPGIEGLAAAGTRFRAAYAPTSATAPSHATLFTGNHPATHGLVKNGLPLRAEVHTLAEILHQRGFDTMAIVSSFVLDQRFGFAQGFSNYQDEFDAAHSSVQLEDWEGHPVPAGFDRPANMTTRQALRWLWFERDESKPFFLFLHYFDPHSPYSPPERTRGRLAPPAAEDRSAARMKPRDVGLRGAIQEYDEEILFTDQEITRLLEELDRLGIARDTLVILVSDHGEGLMDHGFMLHAFDIYEESVRIPLVFRWPGVVAAGKEIAAPVDLSDLMPTILDLLDIDPEGLRFEGRSLAAALRGEAVLDPEHPIFLYRRYYRKGSLSGMPVNGEQFGLRLGDWKLIDHTDPEARDELYDLASDPRERRNLYATETARRMRLHAILEEWKRVHRERIEAQPVSDAVRRALEALGYTE